MASWTQDERETLSLTDTAAWLYALIFSRHLVEDAAAGPDDYDPLDGKTELVYAQDAHWLTTLEDEVGTEYEKVVEASRRVNLDPPAQLTLDLNEKAVR